MTSAQTDQRLRDIDKQGQQASSKKVYLSQLKEFSFTRINADDQNKCKICCYPIIFLIVLILLSIASSFFLPNAIQNIENNTWKNGNTIQICKDHLQLNQIIIRCISNEGKHTKSGAYVAGLVPLNQFLILYLSVKQEVYNNSNIILDETVNFTLYTAQNSDQYIIATSLLITKKINLKGSVKQVFKDGKLFIMYLSKLSEGQDFYWQLQFSNQTQISSSSYFLESQVVNKQFSIFTIVLRVVLFLVSLGVFLKFSSLIFQVPSSKVSIEQRLIQVLSVLNLTFNDQLYFISIVSPNPFSSFLSAFFLWNFVIFLFIIWTIFLNRMIKNEPQTSTKQLTLLKIIALSIFYSFVLAYLVAYAISQTADYPIISFVDMQSNYVTILKIIAFVLFSAASLYIIYLFIRVCRQRTDRIYRHNIFLAFTSVFFISTITFFFIGGYNLFNYSGPKILFTLCFMNMYSFYLQYLYSPTPNFLLQVNQIKIKNKKVVNLQELIEIPSNMEVHITLAQEISQANEPNFKEQQKKSEKSNGKLPNLGVQQMRRYNKNQNIENYESKSQLLSQRIKYPNQYD